MKGRNFKMRSLAVYLKTTKRKHPGAIFAFWRLFDLIVPIVIAQIIDVGIANHNNGIHCPEIFYSYTNGGSWSCQYHHTAQFFAAKAWALPQRSKTGSLWHVQRLSFTGWIPWEQPDLRFTDDVNQIQNGLNGASSSSKSVYRTWVHGHSIYHWLW